MTKENNTSAFPVYLGNKENWDLGMTLRDYFAAKAMQAAIQDVMEVGSIDDTLKGLAVGSYKVADAMLAARGER